MKTPVRVAVTGAAGHGHRFGQTPAGAEIGFDMGRHGAAFDQARHVIAGEAGGGGEPGRRGEVGVDDQS